MAGNSEVVLKGIGMIRGTTKNIALNPVAYKDLDPVENFIPTSIDLRNGHLTDAGNWGKRPGYSEWVDTGVDKPINILIPEGNGYAITEDGRIFGNLSTTAAELTDKKLAGIYRPVYDKHNDLIIIVDGGPVVKIDGNPSALGDNPPSAKFISRLSSYTILSGHDDTQFKWCSSGNPENWTTGDSGFANVKKDGGKIRNQKTLRERLYFFKDNAIEVWINLGGAAQFVRQSGAWINKGCGADYSVVEANDTFYWFGNDGDFYVLDGLQPRVISKSYRAELDKLADPSSIYGFDFRKEGLIRWFAPTDGKCFVYDYVKGIFSEDNKWVSGQWKRLPINSYMELNGKQYFGDYNETGKVYEWSEDYKDDDGDPIRVYRKFAISPSANGHKSRFNQLGFRVKRGVATASEATPEMFFRYRHDQGDWCDYIYLDLGSLGDRNPWLFERGLGIGREIEIEVIQTDAVDYLLTHMNLTARELGR